MVAKPFRVGYVVPHSQKFDGKENKRENINHSYIPWEHIATTTLCAYKSFVDVLQIEHAPSMSI